MRSNDEIEGADSSRWTERFAMALGVVLAQILAAMAVFIIFWILAMNVASRQDGDWAGFGYPVVGLMAAPAVAVIVGPIAVDGFRQPLRTMTVSY